jgi:hypothetical protein
LAGAATSSTEAPGWRGGSEKGTVIDNPTIADDLDRLLGQAMRIANRADTLAALIRDARLHRDTGTQHDCERTIESAWPLACEMLDLDCASLARSPRHTIRERRMAVADSLILTVAWFPTGIPKGERAIGDSERIAWSEFCAVITTFRREDESKDGCAFALCRFRPEHDGRHVRRLARNALARSAVALDIEANKKTGEVPPGLAETLARVQVRGWAAVVYTSHNHRDQLPRYRVVLPLAEEIDPELPAVELLAEALGLAGVYDTSKRTPAALFYLPSCPPRTAELHHAEATPGEPISAAWVREAAGQRLAQARAEQERFAAKAHEVAEFRRGARVADDPDQSLIERLRERLPDLHSILIAHGYDYAGGRYRHPNSTSGSFGATIKNFGSIDRIYSHNGTDPLHRDNLPSWCGVSALDAVDATIILDFGGDRTRALHELAQRHSLDHSAAKRAIAKLIFRMVREGASNEEITRVGYIEGGRLGLSMSETYTVACWVHAQLQREAA